MKTPLCAFVILTALALEASGSLHDELLVDSESEVVYRVPRGAGGRDRKKGSECRYKKGAWEECDVTTNFEKRTFTLKKPDPACEQTKVLTRKCKKACKYEKGEWRECDINTNMRSRTDTLKSSSASSSSCDPIRTVTKKCKKACRYSKQAAWTECDPGTGKKTKVLVLTSGDPQFCDTNRKITKPCRGGRKGGKGRQSKKFDSLRTSQDDDDEDDYDDEE